MEATEQITLTDTHCHLYFKDFDADIDLVIDRARSRGVRRILVPGLDIETSRDAIKLAHNYGEVYAAVGFHPNEGSNWSTSIIRDLKALAADDKVVAIGEIGLDYYRDRTPRALQESIFKKQLDLAAELSLPVIIHNRNAAEDIFTILGEWQRALQKSGLKLAETPGVLHSFSGDADFAAKVKSINFKIGIDGPITFSKKSENLQELVRRLNLEDLLLETDAPFLTPHPYRGKRNEPAYVCLVAEMISILKDNSLEKVGNITTQNASKLFKWSDIL